MAIQVAPHYAGKKACAQAKNNGMRSGKLDTAGRKYFAAIALRAVPRSLAVVPRWTGEDASWPNTDVPPRRSPEFRDEPFLCAIAAEVKEKLDGFGTTNQ
jgi:hypothetical protein